MSNTLSSAPVPDGTGYEPSFFSRSQFVPAKTEYDFPNYADPNTDRRKKVLVVCTEEKYMPMANGTKFSTGNHPVETFVPVLHLLAAGFDVDLFTPTGAPVVLELWALPLQDEAVSKVIAQYGGQLTKPKSLKAFVAGNMQSDTEYVAVFLPGGHGAMLGLPSNEDLRKLIHWTAKEDKFMFAICHGPAALLAASGADFPYNGYKINGFPDRVDATLPEIGYQPGGMPWFYGKKLEDLGVVFLNDNVSGACHADRKLITGDSPMAANRFGRMCAEALLKGK